MQIVLVQDDPAFFAVHGRNPPQPETSTHGVHIRVSMAHHKNIIRLHHQFVQRLGNHPRTDTRPLFHRIGLAAVKTCLTGNFSDNRLISAASQSQIEIVLRKSRKFR